MKNNDFFNSTSSFKILQKNLCKSNVLWECAHIVQTAKICELKTKSKIHENLIKMHTSANWDTINLFYIQFSLKLLWRSKRARLVHPFKLIGIINFLHFLSAILFVLNVWLWSTFTVIYKRKPVFLLNREFDHILNILKYVTSCHGRKWTWGSTWRYWSFVLNFWARGKSLLKITYTIDREIERNQRNPK